ncbi:hypothetical protein ACSSS7_005454 [Eimeria intestinalis]
MEEGGAPLLPWGATTTIISAAAAATATATAAAIATAVSSPSALSAIDVHAAVGAGRQWAKSAPLRTHRLLPLCCMEQQHQQQEAAAAVVAATTTTTTTFAAPLINNMGCQVPLAHPISRP